MKLNSMQELYTEQLRDLRRGIEDRLAVTRAEVKDLVGMLTGIFFFWFRGFLIYVNSARINSHNNSPPGIPVNAPAIIVLATIGVMSSTAPSGRIRSGFCLMPMHQQRDWLLGSITDCR